MSLNNDDIKQLIAILQRGLTNDNTEDQTQEVKPKKKRSKRVDSGKNSDTIAEDYEGSKNGKSKKPMVNKFCDMPEFNLHKEDTAFDKKVKRFPPTPRSRSFNYIQVTCRLCGKTEKVSPSLVDSVERYKCNKCCTMSG